MMKTLVLVAIASVVGGSGHVLLAKGMRSIGDLTEAPSSRLGGILLALVIGGAVDRYAARTGQELFLFSARLVGGAIVFAVLLGAVAAGYATLRVTRLSPAEAIRRGT